MRKFLFLFPILAVAVTTTAMAADTATGVSGSNVTLYGNLVYDESTPNNAPTGIYSTVVEPSASVTKIESQVTKANGGACLADTAYFAIEYTTRYGNVNTCYLNSYNPETWQRTNQVSASHSSIATSLTYNPANKKIYGCFYSEEREKFYFGTINTKTADCDTITFLDKSFNALASDANGELYFVNEEGNFGKISTTDGAITIIGATGFSPKYIQDATFDYGTKLFYWFAYNDDDSQSGIYTVDLATGKATKISTWATGGKEFVGVFSKTPVYAASVPAIPTSMSLSYSGTALAGSVKFVMPTLNYDGSAAQSTLGYEVLVDGAVKLDGAASAGAEVTVDLTVTRGSHDVSVRAKNDAGSGPEYICKQYFGMDVPSAVASVSAERATGGAKIKWDAVTTGAHGAQFDASTVTYNVTRYPDEVVVATGTKATECADNNSVSALGSYYYEVVAVDGDYKAPATKSNSVVLGEALSVPYNKTFSDGDLSQYTIIDANADGSTWAKDSRGAKYTFNNYSAADDWLISPPIAMKANTTYKITAQFANAMDPYSEKAEVKAGLNATADAMTTSVIAPSAVEGGYRFPVDLTGDFVPTVAGDYFVGLHAVSDAGMLYLYCYKLSVEEVVSGVKTIVVDNAVIKAVNGEITVTGAEGSQVKIVSTDGRIVASYDSVPEDFAVAVAPGIYIVTVNGNATKVAVK